MRCPISASSLLLHHAGRRGQNQNGNHELIILLIWLSVFHLGMMNCFQLHFECSHRTVTPVDRCKRPKVGSERVLTGTRSPRPPKAPPFHDFQEALCLLI